MAISNTSGRLELLGNGSATTFSVTYPYYNQTELQVYQGGTLKTLGTHYTVSPTTRTVNDAVGGTVTFVTAPASGESVVILRVEPLTQANNLQDNAVFPADTVEQEFDKRTLTDQQFQEQLNRSLHLPATTLSSISTEVPAPTASKFLQVNSGVTGFEWGTPGSGANKSLGLLYLSDYASLAAAISSIGSTATTLCIDQAASVTANLTSPTTLALWNPGGYVITVSNAVTFTINGPLTAPKRRTQIFSLTGTGAVAGLSLCYPGWFGAKGDGGTTNNSSPFTNAIAATAARGTLKVPYDGNYYALTTGLTISKHMNFMCESHAVQFFLAAGITGFTLGHASEEIIIQFGPMMIISGATAITFTGSNLGKTSHLRGITCSGQTGKAIALEAGAGGLIGVRFVDIDIFGGSTATYGLFLEGDFNANTTIFENIHITGTTTSAVHIKKTTIGSQSGPEFICPVVEANNGRGFYFYRTDVRLYSPYTEQNGLVTDGKDIELDGDTVYQTSVTMIGGTFAASARASNATKVKFLADSVQFNMYGQVTSDTVVQIDNNSKISDIGIYGQLNVPVVNNATNAHVMRYGTRNALFGHGVTTGANDSDVVMKNTGAYRFVNVGGTSSTNFGMVGSSANLLLQVPTAAGIIGAQFGGTSRINLLSENGGGGISITDESSADHSAPSSGACTLYLKDNGAGKTQLIARFNTGAVQVLATEP